MAMRYSKNLPKDAKLEITRMSFIGLPRRMLIEADELIPAKQRFGMVNYVRDTKALNKKRPWYMGKAISQFGIFGGVKIPQGKQAWENIAKTIEKRSV
jgi:hypothetical protein